MILSALSSSHWLPYLNQRLRTLLLSALLVGVGLTLTISAFAALTGTGRTACPNEEPITFSVPNLEKKLIQMGPSRTGDCVTPVAIIMHNTAGGTLDSNWQLFNNNERGGGQNAGFIIGEDGHMYQTVEFYQTMAELTWTSNYVNNYAISIEMVGPYTHDSKESQPTEQYSAALSLVCTLMKQYNIPLGTTEADWTSSSESIDDPELVPGVYGHYQIVPNEKEDPGQGWLADFREDLRAGKCAAGGVTGGGGGGGRIVPYDAYARPYSWPTTGRIRQPYGFTEEAQSLGVRYPGYYPLGDPGAVFSTANHNEPPIDPATAKYINPNIDIEPAGNTASARAVYSTQAGWITYAGWAGPEKGYTIQVESDVEGDGQADLATRYMRLQAPTDGFFAPDIAEFYPENAPVANPTSSNPESTEIHTPPPYTLEAEHMDIADDASAQVVYDNSLANGGASVRFTGNTAIRRTVEQKADQLMIRAKGNTCSIPLIGGPAEMAVMINNEEVGRIEVDSNVFQTYSMAVEGLDGSEHIVTIQMTNAQNLGFCRRELWVDSIYYVITNPNTPTVETVSSATIEAEDLPDVTEGDKKPEIVDDTSASNDQYVAFTSNGKLEGEVEVPDSNYISIRARADVCTDAVPVIKVSVDDAEIISLGVDQDRWTDYSTRLAPKDAPAASTPTTPTTTPDAGSEDEVSTKKLTIEFANDEFRAGECDLNVDVDVITLKKFEVTQTTYSKTSLIGKTKYVAFNQLIGYVSASRGTDVEWEQYVTSNAIDYSAINPGGDGSQAAEQEVLDRQAFISRVPNAQQTYLSYRIMYNNPNFTTFPPPTEIDRFINAKVDDPYIVETDDNKVAGSLKTVYDEPQSPMYFFCALRQRGDNVKCILEPNP